MEKNSYAPLHLRSVFSLLKGCYSPEELCRYARNSSLDTAGLADINNFYGIVRFIRAAKRAGIKPVIGVEIEVKGESLFTAFCKNRKGYARANRLLTRLLADGEFDPVEMLADEGWEGLFLLTSKRYVAERLLPAGRKDLYAALVWGTPVRSILAWGKELDLPAAAVNTGVYLEEGDLSLYRMLRAVDENTTVDALPQTEALTSRHRIVSAEEMCRYFSGLPEVLANGNRIARECSGDLLPESYVFPRFRGMDPGEELRRLTDLCRAGITRRYGAAAGAVEKRLAYELSVISRKNFAGYFLVVHDIVSRCPRTCGRGSSAASIVSYLLGITHVDPLRYNLFFERFLNMGRKDPPDIDVDFPWDEREKALSYVFETYPGRAGMVADHVTFGPRSSLRDPAKAFGLEEEEIDKLLQCLRFGETEKVPEYLRKAARRIRKMPRHIGSHPGGVVITPGALTDYTHYQPAPTGFPVIAWEKDAAEDAGLVKIDILGNRSLGVLRDSIELVNTRYERNRLGRKIEWEGFQPLEDEGARDLIERGDTLGVFYVESPATRQLLKKMGRGDFEHLVIASSIIRPAANRYIRLFVSRLKGETRAPLHPLVDGLLDETRGIMVYQEDVARVAIAAAGFSAAEADGLRKVLSKKDREIGLPAYRKRFFQGGASRGICRGVLEKIWEMVLSFDGYSFCKAHSASYALLSYRLAWMKEYYPLEFLASVINNGGGFYSPQVYINEIRRRGFPICHPDINKSAPDHRLEGNSFRLGFRQLRETPGPFLEKVIEERDRKGDFTDFFDFLRRMSPSYAVVRNLIRSGCLDSIALGMTRPEMFWAFFHRNREEGLFILPPVPEFIGDYSGAKKIYDETETLGLVISCHPLTIFRNRARSRWKILRREGRAPWINSTQISRHIGREVWIAGILVTGKEVRTKKKRYMGFLSFEDPFGVFETVLFPDRYGDLLRVLDYGRAFFVFGRLESEFGTPILEVRRLQSLGEGTAYKEKAEIYRC